jgi:DNA-binding NtrC family response regulator
MLNRRALGHRAVEMLVQQDPKRSADGALALLLGHVRASAAALFQVRNRELVLFVSRGIDQQDLDRARRSWATQQKRGSSRSHAEDAVTLISLDEGGRTLGVLYVGAPHRVSVGPDALEVVAPILLAALRAADNPVAVRSAVDAYLESTPADEVEREQLRLLLSRNDWNIARVARLLGVSRVTVYHRMAKYGLSRDQIQAPAAEDAPSQRPR